MFSITSAASIATARSISASRGSPSVSARPHADGIDAVYYVAQKNYPVEFAEMEFGVRIEGYAIHTDSGGPGLHRGGCGIVRELRVIGEHAVIGHPLACLGRQRRHGRKA